MIELTKGDILRADAEALVNTVNCDGFMGRGIALQFKHAFPGNFKVYAAACKRKELQPGRLLVVETGSYTNPRFIINFPTKRHWRGKSRLADIDSGLAALVIEVQRRGIRSIAVPPLGCGLGGLDWADVRPRIEKTFATLPQTHVMVFEPVGAPEKERIAKTVAEPPMTIGRAVLVGLMERYRSGLLDPFVSLLELHKLMYFSQESGERLRLRYVKAQYGPYAENLRHVLASIEGHLVTGFADGGESPNKPLELLPGAPEKAKRLLSDYPHSRDRFDRVADLVQGFETPFGLELLATVHWVAAHEQATTPNLAVAAVYGWGERKRRFSEPQIRLAWDTLQSKKWLPSAASSAGR